MNKKLLALREKMTAKSKEARSVMDSITDEMTKEQVADIEARFDALMSEHDSLDADYKREERLADAESRSVAAKRPVEDAGTEGAQDEQRSQTPEYGEVFAKHLRFGSADLSVEERQTLQEYRAQGTTPDSAGGYTVPEGFSNELEKSLAVWGPMYDGMVIRYPI